MTEAYLGEARVAVTRIHIPTHIISQIKTKDKDGYNATQVAFGMDRKHPTKALRGHLKTHKRVPRFIREIAPLEGERAIGEELDGAELVKKGDIVTVQGTTKGKGFTGVIKRWGFSRQPKTHGQSDRVRAPGSIGQTTGVARVFKGKKMAGRHGGLTRSVKNANVVHVDEEKQEVWLTGAVPGGVGQVVRLTITGHTDNLAPESETPKQESEQTTKQENVKEEREETAPGKNKEAPKGGEGKT